MARPSLVSRWTGVSLRKIALGALLAGVATLALSAWQRRSSGMPIDLGVYRLAGMKVLHGTGDLYARWVDNRVYGEVFGPGFGVSYPFTYPPFAALLAAPLAVMHPVLATGAWTLACVALLVAMTAMAFDPLLISWRRSRWILLGTLAAVEGLTTPLRDVFFFGQIGLILMALCVLDCTVTRGNRGLLIGLATAIKLIPGLFIVYLAISGQGRAAIRAVVSAAACTMIAAIVLPGASATYWSNYGAAIRRVGDITFFSNQSLDGAIHRLGAPAWLWLPLAGVVTVVGLQRARRAHDMGSERSAIALVGLTTLALSPISWQHHAVWIILVLGVVTRDGTSRRALGAASIVFVVFLLPLPEWGSEMRTSQPLSTVEVILENAYVLAYLVLIALLPMPPDARVDGRTPTAPPGSIPRFTESSSPSPRRIKWSLR